MSFNIHTMLRQVVASTAAKIDNGSIVLNSEIDSGIPYYVGGNQLMLTHILHTLIELSLSRVVKGKLTIKAKAEKFDNGFVTISFMVAHSGSYLSVDLDNNPASFSPKAIRKVSDLIENCGGCLSQAVCAGIGGQFRFSLKYTYAEAQEMAPKGENFLNLFLLRLERMLSFPSIKPAHE